MKIIQVIKADRGFWRNLFETEFDGYRFNFQKLVTGEDIGKKSKGLMWKLSQLNILDVLGVFQRIPVRNDNIDICFSYNRFLNTQIPYIVAVENPTAMVHYHPKRAKSFLGRCNIKRTFSNTNIKAFCCLSKACQSAMEKYYDIPSNIVLTQIYPYIKDEISMSAFNKKIEKKVIKCLFISSDFNLKGGNELIKALIDNSLVNDDRLQIDIITKINGVNPSLLDIAGKSSNIFFHDFFYTKAELNEFYENANIFINMTRKDSFSMVTLEALKFGCAFIATDMYALKEMIREGENGYLMAPPIAYWNGDNTINERLKKKDIIHLQDEYEDQTVVDFLGEKLLWFIQHPEKLKEFQRNSYRISSESEFSNEYILNKWKRLLDKI